MASKQPEIKPEAPIDIGHSAITESDGKSVNVGYLSLFRLLRLDLWLSGVIMLAGFVTQAFDEHHAFPFNGVAAALGAVWGTFATALAALGLFLKGDSA